MSKLNVLEQQINKGKLNSPEMIHFWQEIVRDASGRFKYYQGKAGDYYKGHQPIPNQGAIDFIKTSINVRKQFLNDFVNGGLTNVSAEVFAKKISELHKLQVYKPSPLGNPGEYVKSNLVSGSHGVFFSEIESIAKKYNDKYTKEQSDGIPGYKLNLKGISERGLPRDFKGTHYYPPSKYHAEYIQQMQRCMKEVDIMIKNKKSYEEIVMKLGEMGQYAQNGRFFGNNNYSLFSNINNAILNRLGLKAPEGGIMDLASMRLSQETYKKYYLDEVARINVGKVKSSNNLQSIYI